MWSVNPTLTPHHSLSSYTFFSGTGPLAFLTHSLASGRRKRGITDGDDELLRVCGLLQSTSRRSFRWLLLCFQHVVLKGILPSTCLCWVHMNNYRAATLTIVLKWVWTSDKLIFLLQEIRNVVQLDVEELEIIQDSCEFGLFCPYYKNYNTTCDIKTSVCARIIFSCDDN